MERLTTVKITRRAVLKAIREEPLMPGAFIKGNPKKKNCKVCSVGGVLRQALPVSMQEEGLIKELAGKLAADADAGVDWEERSDELINEKEYMDALSVRFEGLCLEANPDDFPKAIRKNSKIRQQLAVWVKKKLPKEFKIKYSKPKKIKLHYRDGYNYYFDIAKVTL